VSFFFFEKKRDSPVRLAHGVKGLEEDLEGDRKGRGREGREREGGGKPLRTEGRGREGEGRGGRGRRGGRETIGFYSKKIQQEESPS
jgi:hypothetical protein